MSDARYYWWVVREKWKDEKDVTEEFGIFADEVEVDELGNLILWKCTESGTRQFQIMIFPIHTWDSIEAASVMDGSNPWRVYTDE